MSEFVEVSQINELRDGTMKEVLVQGREILLARVGDKYYAANNRCPHMGAKLAQGKLEGTIVTCPKHGSQFELSDGHVVRWTNWSGLISAISKVLKSPTAITVYNVKAQNDKILIEI